MYKIEFSSTAGKILENIYKHDRSLYSRLIHAIEHLQTHPFEGKRLKGQFKGDWSLRVGTYRIIYTVFKERLLISIIDIGHRKDIYR